MADSQNTTDHAAAQVRAKFILNIQPPSHTDPDDNLARCYLEREAMLGECRKVLGAASEVCGMAMGSRENDSKYAADTYDRIRSLLSRLSTEGK